MDQNRILVYIDIFHFSIMGFNIRHDYLLCNRKEHAQASSLALPNKVE